MTEPEITVNKLSYHIPVQLLGLDEQGRQLYRCPSAGCGETAYFDEDGRGHCPTDEAMLALIRDAYERLTSQTPECNHATCLELSVPGQSHRTWQCTTCGAQVETPWAS